MKSVIYNGLANTFGTMQNRMVKDSKGNLYLAMFSYSPLGDGYNARYNLMVYKSTDNGQTWRELPHNAPLNLQNYKPSLTIDSNDKLTVVWQGLDDKNAYYVDGQITRIPTIKYMTSTDGEVFSEPKDIFSGDMNKAYYDPVSILDNEGNLHVVYTELAGSTKTVKHTYQTEGVWSTPETIFSGSDIKDNGATHIAKDSKGNIYVVYSDLGDEGSSLLFSNSADTILMRRLNAISKTWDETILVNPETTGLLNFQAKLAVDDDDRVLISWFGQDLNRAGFVGKYRTYFEGELSSIETVYYSGVSKGVEGGLGLESNIRNMTLVPKGNEVFMIFNATDLQHYHHQYLKVTKRTANGKWTPAVDLAYGSYPNVLLNGNSIDIAFMDYADNCISYLKFNTEPTTTVDITSIKSTVENEVTEINWASNEGQNAYQVVVYGAHAGEIVYESGLIYSSSKTHKIPANTLKEGQYEAGVIILDREGRMSDISNLKGFSISYPLEVPKIDFAIPYSVGLFSIPKNDYDEDTGKLKDQELKFMWSYNSIYPQDSYRLKIIEDKNDGTGETTVMYDSGVVKSRDNYITVTGKFNGIYEYRVILTVTNTIGASKTIELNYTNTSDVVNEYPANNVHPDNIVFNKPKAGEPLEVSWRFRSKRRTILDDGKLYFLGNQSAFRLLLREEHELGRIVFDSGLVHTMSTKCVIPANIIKDNKNYVVAIKTVSDEGVHSLWATREFNTSLSGYPLDPPTVNITGFDTSTEILTWEFTGGTYKLNGNTIEAPQAGFQYKIKDLEGNVLYESDRKFSTEGQYIDTRSTILKYVLENGNSYTIELTVWQYPANVYTSEEKKKFPSEITPDMLDATSGQIVTSLEGSGELRFEFVQIPPLSNVATKVITFYDFRKYKPKALNITRDTAESVVRLKFETDPKFQSYNVSNITYNAEVYSLDGTQVWGQYNASATNMQTYWLGQREVFPIPEGVYKYRVNIKKDNGLTSDWSNFALINIPESPVIFIKNLDENGNSTLYRKRSVVNIEYNGQAPLGSYNIVLKDSAGVELFNSGWVESTSTLIPIDYDLVDGENYKVAITVKDNVGTTSNTVNADFNVKIMLDEAPKLNPISTFDALNHNTVSWTYVPPIPNSRQSAYQLVVVDASDNEVYNTGKIYSEITSHVIPAHTLTNGYKYTIKVRTWDNHNIISGYGVVDVVPKFDVSTQSVVIVSPKNNSYITEDKIALEWNTTGAITQTGFTVRLLDGSGNNPIFTETRVGSSRYFEIPYTLSDTTKYQVDVTVRNIDGTELRSQKVIVNTLFTESLMPESVTVTNNMDISTNNYITWKVPVSTFVQSAYQLVISRVSDGGIVLDTGKVTSENMQHLLQPYSLTAGTNYIVKVRVWDEKGKMSKYSSGTTFSTREVGKPVVDINYPVADGDKVTDKKLTVTWTYLDGTSQASYQVKLINNQGEVVEDSGKVTNAILRAHTFNTVLENFQNYTVTLVVWNKAGVSSNEQSRTFQVNLVPNKPTNLQCGTFDARTDKRISWKYNGVTEGSTQSAFQVRITRVGYGEVFNTGKVISPNEYYVIPANTLDNGVNYYFEVNTFDENGNPSGYSDRSYFTTKLPSPPPVITITSPSASIINSNQLLVKWYYESELLQKSFEVVLYEEGVQVYNSNEITSTSSRQHLIPLELEDGKSYEVQVRAWNEEGTVSNTASKVFSVDIVEDIPPSNLMNSPVSANLTTNLSWRFNPAVEGDTQVAYQVVIRNDEGVVILDTGKVISNKSEYSVPEGVLPDNSIIWWKVKTWSIRNSSEFSAEASFTTPVRPPKVMITHPINNVSSSEVVVKWSYESPRAQKSFEIDLVDADGKVLFTSGTVISGEQEYVIPYQLNDKSKYVVRLKVFDNEDNSSELISSTFFTNFVSGTEPVAVTGYLAELSNNSQSKIVSDKDGVMYEAHQRGSQIEVFKSLDGGLSWESTGVPQVSGALRFRPSLVVGNDKVYLFFTERTTGVSYIAYMEYDGTSWLNRGSVSNEPNYNQTDVDVAIDSNGRIMAVWTGFDEDNKEKEQIKGALISNGNITPFNISNISGFKQTSPTVVVRNNTFYVFWSGEDDTNEKAQIKMSKFSTSWSPWVNITTNNEGSLGQTSPSVTVDRDNNIHLVWVGSTILAQESSQVQYSKSSDGNVWSPVEVISDELGYNQQSPNVSASNDGSIFIVWSGRDSNNPIYEQVKYVRIDGDEIEEVKYLSPNKGNRAIQPATMSNMIANRIGVLWVDYKVGSIMFHKFCLGEPPIKPTNLEGENFDAVRGTTLSWKFNTLNYIDAQTAYEIVVMKEGQEVFTTGKTISSIPQGHIPPNVLQNDQTYTWKVRVYGADGLASPFSDSKVIYTSTAPLAIVTQPSSTQKLTGNVLRVVWNYIGLDTQKYYKIVLKDTLGATLWSSGKVQSNKQSVLVDYNLENLKDYRIELEVWNSKNVISNKVVVDFSTDFILMPKPVVTTEVDTNGFGIKLNIDNLSQDSSLVNEVYKSEDGNKFIKIADNIKGNSSYTDFNVASNKVYYYYVRVLNDQGVSRNSSIYSDSIVISKPIINLVRDYREYLLLNKSVRRDIREDIEMSVLEFAGRSKPVSEFGEHSSHNINISFLAVQDSEVDKFYKLYRDKSLVMYRDPRGRKVYGTMTGLKVVDKSARTYEISFDFLENDYSEGI